MRRTSLPFLALAAVLASAPRASAGELDRIEQSHRPPDPSTSTSSSSSSSSSSSRSSSSRTSSEGSFVWPCLVLGPWTGYCFYGESWLRAERGEEPESLAPKRIPAKNFVGQPVGSDGEVIPSDAAADVGPREDVARRYGELQGSTFLGARDKIWGFDLRARAWLWVGGLDFAWLRLHEPESTTLDRLDLLHASTVGTFIAARWVEAHVLLGVDLLHGHDWTPAFGPGLEVRTYPLHRIAIGASSRASIFADGYPLVDSRLDVGLAIGRIDVLLGGRWLFQAYQRASATSILGPSVSLLLRLGP